MSKKTRLELTEPESFLALGQRIHEAREAKGMSMRELSKKTGYSAARICRIEKGTGAIPNVENIYYLAEVLHIPFLELLLTVYPKMKLGRAEE